MSWLHLFQLPQLLLMTCSSDLSTPWTPSIELSQFVTMWPKGAAMLRMWSGQGRNTGLITSLGLNIFCACN